MVNQLVKLIGREGADQLSGVGSASRAEPRSKLYEFVSHSELEELRERRPGFVLPLSGLSWSSDTYCRGAP